MSDTALSVSQVQQARDMFFVQGLAPEGVLPEPEIHALVRAIGEFYGPDPTTSDDEPTCIDTT